MAKDLDDDIVDVQAPEQESEDDDDIVDVQAAPSLLDKALTKGKDLITPSEDSQELAMDTGLAGRDFAVGSAKGLTMGALDELGGLIGSGVESGLGAMGIGPAAVDADLAAQGFKGVDESFTDKYRGYQEATDQFIKEGEERSPVLSTVGQLAGGVTGGMALGGLLGVGKAAKGAESIADIARNSGKAKAAMELLKRGGANYMKAAPAIGLESALTSEADLIGSEANPMAVGADALGGMAFGLPAVMGLQAAGDVMAPAAGKALQKVQDKLQPMIDESPLLRQIGIAYNKYGKELKTNPKSETAILEGKAGVEGGTPFSLLDSKRATEITDQVLDVDDALGKLVGKSIDDSKNIRIDAADITKGTVDEIIALADEMPSLIKDENFNKVMSKILSRNYKDASPRDIKNAIDDITNSIDRIGAYKGPSPELEEAPRLLRKLRAQLDTRLKDTVPAYRNAAERFSQHRVAYLEQPISGRLDPELDDIFYGKMKKGEKKLTEAYEDMVKRTTTDSQSAEGTEARFSKLGQATKKFQEEELKRVAKGDIDAPITQDPNILLKQIKDYADDAAVRRTTRKTQESQAGGVAAAKNMFGLGDTGRGFALSTAYRAGRIAASKPVKGVANITKAIYNAPAQTLTNVAQRIEQVPGLDKLGKALREAVESGDSNKKNAALFTIMQNPNARMLISAEDVPDEENME